MYHPVEYSINLIPTEAGCSSGGLSRKSRRNNSIMNVRVEN